MTSKRSLERGYGTVCWRKVKAAEKQKQAEAYYPDVDLVDAADGDGEDEDGWHWGP